MKVNGKDYPIILWKIKFMFETTNQIYYLGIPQTDWDDWVYQISPNLRVLVIVVPVHPGVPSCARDSHREPQGRDRRSCDRTTSEPPATLLVEAKWKSPGFDLHNARSLSKLHHLRWMDILTGKNHVNYITVSACFSSRQ